MQEENNLQQPEMGEEAPFTIKPVEMMSIDFSEETGTFDIGPGQVSIKIVNEGEGFEISYDDEKISRERVEEIVDRFFSYMNENVHI